MDKIDEKSKTSRASSFTGKLCNLNKSTEDVQEMQAIRFKLIIQPSYSTHEWSTAIYSVAMDNNIIVWIPS